MRITDMLDNKDDSDNDLEDDDNDEPGTNTDLNLDVRLQRRTDEQVYGLARQNCRSQFFGYEQFKPEIVYGFRSFIKQNITRKSPRDSDHELKIDTMHCRELEPLCRLMKEFVGTQIIYPSLGKKTQASIKFLAEIAEHEANRTVSSLWIFFFLIRYSMAISDISEQETDLFKSVIHPEIFAGLIKNDGWQSEFQSILNIESVKYTDHSYDSKTMPRTKDFTDQNNFIYGELTRLLLGGNFVYPFFGIGKIGISLMVRLWLQQVSPIGLFDPNKHDGRLPAHGVRLSSGPFALHDMLHSIVDEREKRIRENIKYWTDQAVQRGIDWQEFNTFYTPQAVEKFNSLNKALLEMHNLFMRFLLPNRRADYDKAMNGFFFITHEYPAFEYDTIDSDDLGIFLNAAIDATKASLQSQEMWESSDDPLCTSPIDGKSHLGVTEEESKIKIVQYFLDELIKKPDMLHKDRAELSAKSLSGEEAETFIREKTMESISSINLEMTEHFIRIRFNMSRGTFYNYERPTLCHKWRNMDDSIGLLKIAGIKIKKPDISGLEFNEARSLAQKTLWQVREYLVQTLEHFRAVAVYFINMKQPDGLSIADRFYEQQAKRAQHIRFMGAQMKIDAENKRLALPSEPEAILEKIAASEQSKSNSSRLRNRQS